MKRLLIKLVSMLLFFFPSAALIAFAFWLPDHEGLISFDGNNFLDAILEFRNPQKFFLLIFILIGIDHKYYSSTILKSVFRDFRMQYLDKPSTYIFLISLIIGFFAHLTAGSIVDFGFNLWPKILTPDSSQKILALFWVLVMLALYITILLCFFVAFPGYLWIILKTIQKRIYYYRDYCFYGIDEFKDYGDQYNRWKFPPKVINSEDVKYKVSFGIKIIHAMQILAMLVVTIVALKFLLSVIYFIFSKVAEFINGILSFFEGLINFIFGIIMGIIKLIIFLINLII